MQRIFLILLLVAFVTTTATAQTTQRITIDEAIDIALENNFQLRQAENNLDLAEKNIIGEYADFAPTLNGNLSGSSSEGQQFIAEINTFGNFINNSVRGGLNVGLPIFNGFENIRSLRSSQLNKQSREENLRRARETVIFNTASGFLQVILDRELLEIARQNLETSRKQLEQIKAQVEVGTRPSVDQFNQEATVANNELEVTNRENALELSRIQLIRQMQIDPLGDYEFVIPKANPDELDPNLYNLNKLVDTALENRADINSQELAIKIQEYQVKIARGAMLPSVNLNAGISSSYSDQSRNRVPDPNNPGQSISVPISFEDQFFDQQITKSIGFSVQIPILNGLNQRLNMETQKINYKNARLDLENIRLQVVQEVTQAFNDYTAVVKQLEASKKSLEASQKAFETQQERYNVGASTLIELSQAQADFVQAQSNYTQAIYNFIFQEKLLDYYLGKLDANISLN